KSVELLKKNFVDKINRLVSQKRTGLAEKNRADVQNLFLLVETWAVFKASRSQAGQILHFAHRFLQRKAKKTWNQVELSPPHLTYLPRLPNYADTIFDYNYRRSLYDQHGVEVPLDIIKGYFANHNNIMVKSYIAQELKKQKEGKAIAKKADELYLEVLQE